MPDSYNYDVVISFAEENRDAAHHLADKLKQAGLKCYYYPDHILEDVGLELEAVLSRRYANESRIAVTMLSEKYFTKSFTRLELRAIRERMIQNGETVYLVPVLMDNCDLSNHPDLQRLAYLKWNHAPDTVVAIVCRLLGKSVSSTVSPGTLSESHRMHEMIIRATHVTINYLQHINMPVGSMTITQNFNTKK